jgi:uncharacterized DUF497 family protein
LAGPGVTAVGIGCAPTGPFCDRLRGAGACIIYLHLVGADSFDWDPSNVGHIARHGVQPTDVEQALASDSTTIQSVVAGSGEERWFSVGPTSAGRLLAVVRTMRGARVRVVTAYPASKRLRAAYDKAKTDSDGAAGQASPPVQD